LNGQLDNFELYFIHIYSFDNFEWSLLKLFGSFGYLDYMLHSYIFIRINLNGHY
jgi:hypothetical protein